MSLQKDISFIVVDGGFGLGNGQCFPSGPMRETLNSGTQRADAAIVVNRTKQTKNIELNNLPQFDATIKLQDTSKDQDDYKVIAFAGIARPEKFFNTLEDNGYTLHAHYSFPDHAPYTHGQIKKMVSHAQKEGLELITTEKDWVRLSKSWQSQIAYLKITIEFNDDFKTYFIGQLDQLR